MKAKVILFLIFLLAIVVRSLYYDSITFFYDQARDALTSMEIWGSDPIKVIGPQTDFVGLHHGPFYWYLISPFYYFGGGDIRLVKFVLVLINSLTIFIIYDLCRSLFKNKKISLLSSFLFAISFEAVQYARWLSNPAPAILTITLSFWALYKLIKGESKALILLVISWGLSIHFQLFLLYQLPIFILIWTLIGKEKLPKITRKEVLISLFAFFSIISPFIISEIKFNFQGTKVFANFFKNQTLFGQGFWNLLENYIDRLGESFFLNIWGVNLFLAGIMTFVTFYFTFNTIQKRKNRNALIFLLVWILSPILINLFTGPNARFINIGITVPIIIITAYFITNYVKNRLLFILILLIVIIGNLNLILTKNKEGEVLFTVQKQMILKDELSVIDYVYKESEGKVFKLNTITNPLFINSTWSHLFNWYGKSKYGFMPIWWGETQVDVPGDNIKFADDTAIDLFFLIIEPGVSGDDNYVKAIKIMENTRSTVIESENIGFFTVEKRRITNPRIYTAQDVFYVIKNTDMRELQKVK